MKAWKLASVAFLLLFASACGSPTAPAEPAKPAGDNAKAEAEKEAAIASARNNPLEGIVNSFQKSLEAKSFRAQLESTSEGRTSTIRFEFVAPDRYRMLNGPTEMIVIGGEAFMKTLGSWQKIATGLQGQLKAIRDTKMVEELKKATEVKFIQPDMLDGQPVLVYEYTSTNVMGLEGASHSKTWVGMFDGLPRKSEFESTLGSVKSKGLMTWYDFNADIKIEPPLK